MTTKKYILFCLLTICLPLALLWQLPHPNQRPPTIQQLSRPAHERIQGQLANGETKFDRQIVVDKENGFQLLGRGRIDNYTRPRGNYSRLLWTGDDRIAIRLGSRNFEIANVTIAGGDIHVPALRGYGTGNGVFRNVGFLDATVIAGSHGWNGNADEITFDRCWFRNVRRARDRPAFENTSSQNIQFVFRDCTFKNFETLLDIAGGGHIKIEDCYFNEIDIVLKVTGDGSKLGRQNGSFLIANTHFDAKQKRYPTILLDTSHYGAGRRLTVRDCRFYRRQFSMPNPTARKFVDIRSPYAIWQIRFDTCDNIPENEQAIIDRLPDP